MARLWTGPGPRVPAEGSANIILDIILVKPFPGWVNHFVPFRIL